VYTLEHTPRVSQRLV